MTVVFKKILPFSIYMLVATVEMASGASAECNGESPLSLALESPCRAAKVPVFNPDTGKVEPPGNLATGPLAPQFPLSAHFPAR